MVEDVFVFGVFVFFECVVVMYGVYEVWLIYYVVVGECGVGVCNLDWCDYQEVIEGDVGGIVVVILLFYWMYEI